MEKWKWGVVAVLFASVFGYGSWQALSEQKTANALVAAPGEPPTAEPLMKLETAPEYENLVGKPLPAWNIPTAFWTNGKAVSPASLKGQISLVEIFRIKCSHCQEAAPHMQHLQKTYGPKGLKIVALQAPARAPEENDWNLVQQTVGPLGWGLNYPVGFDAKAAYFKGKIGGRKVPTIFLLDREGRVMLGLNGHNEKIGRALEDRIQKELQK